jgi:hypothetical protein
MKLVQNLYRTGSRSVFSRGLIRIRSEIVWIRNTDFEKAVALDPNSFCCPVYMYGWLSTNLKRR